jgi:hypothetical protein
MEEFINFFLGIIVLFVPPILMLRYFFAAYKKLKSDDSRNEEIIFYDTYGQASDNSLSQVNKVGSGKENTAKLPVSMNEVDVADSIRADEFYLWLIEEGYIKREDEN